jgi:hypothetical protein
MKKILKFLFLANFFLVNFCPHMGNSLFAISDSCNLTNNLKLNERVNIFDNDKVVCEEKDEKDPESMMPVNVKVCTYKKFKTQVKRYMNFNGRSYFNYTMFMKDANGNFIEVKNTDIFNQNQEVLLAKLNARFKAEYDSFSTSADTKDCFINSSFSNYSLENVSIEFEDSKINFIVNFDVTWNCSNVSMSIFSLSLDEAQKFLVE